MPTEIRFDLSEIDTEVELLRQICARMDLDRPNVEGDLLKADALKAAKAKIEEVASGLDGLELTALAAEIRGLVA